MTKTMTASELLAQIEKDFFKGVGLDKASQLEGEERRSYRLSQVERLLTEENCHMPLAIWLSDVFWTAEEGRIPAYEDHPLLWQEEHQTLTDRELRRLRLIMEVADLCHDLGLQFPFDMKAAFGIRNNSFQVSNKRLVEWLTTTEFERIAMYTTYIMKRQAIMFYADTFYQPAQDELAEFFSSKYGELVQLPYRTKIPPRDYVRIILDRLQSIERHRQRGRRLKLKPELMMLHDEIYGLVPRHFDKGVLRAAQALYDYMDKELQGSLVLKEYDSKASSWSEQPESVRRTWGEVLSRFAEKVREVRSQYLTEGWVTDNSLAFNYLMAHAERCGQGLWNGEEGDKL